MERIGICIEDIDFIDTADFEALNPFIGMESIVKKSNGLWQILLEINVSTV